MASDGGSQAAEMRTSASEDRRYSAADERSVECDRPSSDEERGRVENDDWESAAAGGVEPSWGKIAVGRSLPKVKEVGQVKVRQIQESHRRRCSHCSREIEVG